MNSLDLEPIKSSLADVLKEPVIGLRKLDGSFVSYSDDLFDTNFLCYQGLAASASKKVYAFTLRPNNDGWEAELALVQKSHFAD
jgi:hypothetical protein